MSSNNVKKYFDIHSHDHVYSHNPDNYNGVVKKLKNEFNKKIRILDVGCGTGTFIKCIINNSLYADIVGVDLSESMIATAQDLFGTYPNVRLQAIDAFDLKKQKDYSKFDVIHIDSVLHHLIGGSPQSSKKLANQMIAQLVEMLTDEGVLVVEEMFYTSYIIRTITSRIIFHGLKLLNSLRIDLHKYMPEIHLGLEVNFFDTHELDVLLNQHGHSLQIYKNENSTIPKLYQFLLLREFGRVTYFLKMHQS